MISVVMPVYNGSAYVAQAIESVRQQTFPDFEMIIVDDGSTDQTQEIVLQQAAQDRRIRVILADHAGDIAARNMGIHEARYPLIAAMDADDVALPTRFARQLATIVDNPRIVALGTAVCHITSSGKVLSVSQHGPLSEAEFHERRRIGADISLYHPTVLLRKEIWSAVGGYDRAFQTCDDFDLFDRMAAHGLVLTMPDPLIYYRVHLQSLSMQKFFFQRELSRYITARNQARIAGLPAISLEKFLADCSQQPLSVRWPRRSNDLSHYHYRKGGLYYGEGEYLRALLHFGASAILRPDYALPRLWRQRLTSKSRQQLTELFIQ